jgi:hypothetical protein
MRAPPILGDNKINMSELRGLFGSVCSSLVRVTSNFDRDWPWDFHILIKKQITYSVDNPRDEFIKHN